MYPYAPNYNGGTALHPAGGTSTVNVPANSRSAILIADAGVAYYAVNGTAAGTNSPGYLPQGIAQPVLTCENFVTLSVEAAAGVTVYIQYYTA